MGNEFEVRLHQHIEELVRSRVRSLEQDISRLQREVNQGFTSLLESSDAAGSLTEADDTIAQIVADVEGQVGLASAESAKLGSDLALLRDSVDELGSQTTQSEVLNKLVDRLVGFAPRLVLFVMKGNNALAWATRGFDEPGVHNAMRGLSVSLESDTILRLALNSQQTFYGSPDQQSENQAILGRMGRTVPARLLAVPLKVRGKSAAVLYADSADRGLESINVEAIELLVYTTGLVVELTSLRARIGESGTKPVAESAPAGAAPAPSKTGSEVAAQPSTSGSLNQQPSTRPSSGELRQPPTFFRPATEPHQSFEGSAGTARPPAEPARPAAARPGPVDDEEKQHNDARRFARLLVSEIKLYNEQKVAEGRTNNDLYDRLKDDIDRSRQMYDKRVSPGVAGKFDYFYDELVNTLAEGDPSKLGSDYPGPSARM